MIVPKPLTNLDLDCVRAFVAIAQAGSFTRAAHAMHRQQSTLSLQLKRLEDAVGRRLIDRSPRLVKLTTEGELFLGYACRLLSLNDEVVSRVSEPQIAGIVRLGTPEDFATAHLPNVLARFARAYPAVSLEVTCDLTLHLMDAFGKGAFDLALIKRERSVASGGMRVWREPLVWVSSGVPFATGTTLPLVVSPTPCVYRKRAVDALDRAKRPWRVAYTCGSLAGSVAAVKAGLGVTVLPKEMVPPDLTVIDGGLLPTLRDTEIALLQRDPISAAARRLRDHMVQCFGSEQTSA